MIYKFNNGGAIKLQNAGNVPDLTPQQQKLREELDYITKYNREHGTNFWKMSQVLEHDKQQAQQKTQDKKKSFWEILAGHPESAGEAILNKTIETANNAELPETRSKIYNDTGKAQLATTAGSLLTLPMLGEFSTYGLLGGSARLAGGMAGSAVGSYTLGKAGELGDRTFGTTWMKPAGQVIGGFAGWVPGSNFAYKGALDLASKVPSIARIGTTDRFIGDVAGRALGKSVDKTTFVPAQVKYYGPTMGKSYAAKTNPNLIDLDTWGRSEYDQLAKKYGYKDWREMILSDKGDYNEEYKQLIKDQIRRIQSDPQYSGKTIVVSNASLLKPNSGITFANTPVIPERSVMAARNTARHPWESIEHGEEWWDSLQRKGTPLRIDNRFISDIEGNKAISFAPAPQKFVSTVHFDPRVKPLSRPISEAEKLGIPKSERPMYDPEVFQKAKLFAEEYGYPEPKTPTEIKDMYRRHNTFFRTVGDLDRVYFPKNYESLPDEFKSLSLPEQRKFLASRGYPSYFRGYFNDIEGPFSDEFVFVSPSLEENSDYFINNALDNTVKLQRPFSLRDPKKWHIEADWRIHPANSWKERWWPKGRIEIGNASPSREFKVSTKHLIPVDIAKQDDLGTLLPQYFRKRINDAVNKDWWKRPNWLQEDYNGNYEIDYFGILPEKFNYKQGGILKAQNGKPSYQDWLKTVNPSFIDKNYDLETAYNNLPFELLEAWRIDPENNHLPSGTDFSNGNWQYLKSPLHKSWFLNNAWEFSKEGKEWKNQYVSDNKFPFTTLYKINKSQSE